MMMERISVRTAGISAALPPAGGGKLDGEKSRAVGIMVAATFALLAVAGCDRIDPLNRDGVWHPSHVNRVNLTVMAANPMDLVRGRGAATSDGQLDAAAIQRLHDNKVKKLPDAGLSDVKVQGQGSSGD